jgi:diguanylate cyclase (GGDEF)-like protein/PAS domain S-box-containing protein
MLKASPAVRISLGLVMLTASILFAADLIGLLPSRAAGVLDGRKKFCEALAVQCSVSAGKNDITTILTTIRVVAGRNDDILSAAIRGVDGEVLAASDDHEAQWSEALEEGSSPTHVRVPIFKGDAQWATVEVCFTEITPGVFASISQNPLFGLLLFVIPVAMIVYRYFMKKTLRYLDPSSVVPERVKSALNALSEGVILMDRSEHIVLVNSAFVEIVGQPDSALLGKKVSELDWTVPRSSEPASEFPWRDAMRKGENLVGVPLSLSTASGTTRIFMVNGAPITDGGGKARGALATFDDVTHIEEQNEKLQEMLKALEESREEVRRQNENLQILATQDPLTGCLNRRAFLEKVDADFDKSRRYGYDISFVMVDVDHFKSVNDRYGHAVGDDVLKGVSAALKSTVRSCDSVCRYGGEEFCILLPHTGLEGAARTAENCRKAIESLDCSGVSVTASFGVSSVEAGRGQAQDILNMADKALYAAKESGRNRVVCSDAGEIGDASEDSESSPVTVGQDDRREDALVSLKAVHSLLFALDYRDTRAAEHSRQVAELCVAVAQGHIPSRKCMLLDIAALLHDIGKLGVPDTILLKAGPLTPDEREVMSSHEKMGVAMIESTFNVPELTEMVANRKAWYGGNSNMPGLPTGDDIPVGARILGIAESFLAMISPRPYREAMDVEEAFEELRRCSGLQFDPEWAGRFIDAVKNSDFVSRYRTDHTSPAVFLQIGRLLDRLSYALQSNDIPMMDAISSQLATALVKHGDAKTLQLAAELQLAIHADQPDMVRILKLTTSLLQNCRSAENCARPETAPAA